jgi:hypothetical protein
VTIELYHPTDPRFLLVDAPPECVTVEDLGNWRYGKALLFAPGPVDLVYLPQEDPLGTMWVKPT